MQNIIGMFYPLVLYVLFTVIVVVVLVQVFGTYRAKSNIMREEAYQKLSERATTAEQKAADQQQKIAESLEDIRVRLAAIEKTLHDVE
jgi:uncharacterized membrane protein